ncbi:hypothetical protein [Nocardia tengchongensis]|uniref:hypothetical protein n=1 Tax=Nocardia tengchongensis TaxID=2055889 RepID=UPI003655461D
MDVLQYANGVARHLGHPDEEWTASAVEWAAHASVFGPDLARSYSAARAHIDSRDGLRITVHVSVDHNGISASATANLTEGANRPLYRYRDTNLPWRFDTATSSTSSALSASAFGQQITREILDGPRGLRAATSAAKTNQARATDRGRHLEALINEMTVGFPQGVTREGQFEAYATVDDLSVVVDTSAQAVDPDSGALVDRTRLSITLPDGDSAPLIRWAANLLQLAADAVQR